MAPATGFSQTRPSGALSRRPATTVAPVTLPPSEPPASGAAVEQPPHGEKDRPRTTVYRRGQHYLWVFWPQDWQLAEVIARQDYPNGAVVYQVELLLPDGSNGIRTFAWGTDNIRRA